MCAVHHAGPGKPSIRASGSRLQERKHSKYVGLLNPIITMDESGVIRSASDSVEQVFGWTPTELFGRNVKILIPEPRRSLLDRYLDRYRNSDSTKSLTRTRRFDAVRKDGSRIQIELSMSRAELPIHSAPFFIGIVRDVSREIDTGPDSVTERSRLHGLIMEQTRALATAHLRLQLADRMAALGTLAAGLGHDLNNVLLPVRARLDAMEHARSMTAARTHMKALRLQVSYLQNLSDGLHALTLDPDGHADSDDGAGATQLSEWWLQLGPLLRKSAPKRVSISASFPTDLPCVNIAPQWLTQAILNLIVNAGEAIPKGRKGRIRIWADTEAGTRMVRLGVTDNGSGMTRELQRRALDLFFTTKSRSMGTGLGLLLARKVALRAGGELVILSRPGKGTTVILELPVVEPTHGQAGRLASSAVAAAGGQTADQPLAVVSIDNDRIAALIGQVLLAAGLGVKLSIGRGLGKADLWVTDPTDKAMATALRWRKHRPTGVIALVGAPAARRLRRWAALEAIVIESGDDLRSVRTALGEALARL